MPISPVERMRILSEPAVVKIMAWDELAVRVLLLEMRVVLADWMVRVEVVPVVCQVEAAAPVRFKLLVAEIVSVFMTMVPPMVVVPTKMLAHLAALDPMLYVRLAFGKRSPVIVVVATANVPLKIALPVP